ncbi:ribonuclease II [Thecamonas trahens ATCC 50062]|uniref:Ribonuclease II n=1 Tax=Thecamonas trahens ATCC 50062 TaxID=461836 RepID=A0A0L0D9W5_THETB|nr:ribonuclease II [Thecamonas trahens ATCC 50062]KNC49152.1 ribonuclease II [Thecamonas trahens ATCC 50062]|eukprot:XP_013758174.1 ribonuclease II [Thecamonas trahens ATCC 50062]
MLRTWTLTTLPGVAALARAGSSQALPVVEYVSHAAFRAGTLCEVPTSSEAALVARAASGATETIHPSQVVDVWPAQAWPESHEAFAGDAGAVDSFLATAAPGSLSLEPVWTALLGQYKHARLRSHALARILWHSRSTAVRAVHLHAAFRLLADDDVFFKRGLPYKSPPRRSQAALPDLLAAAAGGGEWVAPGRDAAAAAATDAAIDSLLFAQPGKRGYAPRSRQAVRTSDAQRFMATVRERMAQIRRKATPRAWSRARDLPLLLALETYALGAPSGAGGGFMRGRAGHTARSILRTLGLAQEPSAARQLLVECGHLAADASRPVSEAEAALRDTFPPFPAEVKAAAEAVEEAAAERVVELGARVDLRHIPALAIDAPSASIVDDAIGLDPASGEVLVHVADPLPAIELGSVLDSAAHARIASCYFPGAPQHMLPPRGLAALGFQTQRATYALTARIRLERNGRVASSSLERSLVGPVERLSFGEADEALLDGAEPLLPLYGRAAAARMARSRASGRHIPKHRLLEEPAKLLVQECMNLANAPAVGYAAAAGVPLPGGRAATITSPLRRYLDLAAHRNLPCALDGGAGQAADPEPELRELYAVGDELWVRVALVSPGEHSIVLEPVPARGVRVARRGARSRKQPVRSKASGKKQ